MEKVTKVYDGDSFVTTEQHVRLADVNTPEAGQPGYDRAKNALTALIYDKFVNVHAVATGHYGRTIANVTVGDGKGGLIDVNATMKQYE